MILAKQPSIGEEKLPRDLIAHIEPADDDLLTDEIDAVLDDEPISEQNVEQEDKA